MRGVDPHPKGPKAKNREQKHKRHFKVFLKIKDDKTRGIKTTK